MPHHIKQTKIRVVPLKWIFTINRIYSQIQGYSHSNISVIELKYELYVKHKHKQIRTVRKMLKDRRNFNIANSFIAVVTCDDALLR